MNHIGQEPEAAIKVKKSSSRDVEASIAADQSKNKGDKVDGSDGGGDDKRFLRFFVIEEISEEERDKHN